MNLFFQPLQLYPYNHLHYNIILFHNLKQDVVNLYKYVHNYRNYYNIFQSPYYPSSMCNRIPEKIKIAKVDGPNATSKSGTCSVNANDSKSF